MSTLYEIVELANGDIALQKEGDAKKVTNRAPLVTMRFSTDLLRFLRGAKMDIAKVMIEAGLERVANLAESVTREPLTQKPLAREQGEAKLDTPSSKKITNPKHSTKSFARRASDKMMQTTVPSESAEKEDRHPIISHLLH